MIHTFEFDGKYYVLDVESGSVHGLDRLSFDVLNNYGDPYSVPADGVQIDEILEEIRELTSQGLLFTEPSAQLSAEPSNVIKSMCLHIAHDCNLRCSYCFGSTGTFHGKRELMSAQTAEAAIDFLLERSGKRHNLEVDFFGGEPMMNLDVMRECVAYGRKREREYGKKIAFTVTTNAYELNEDILSFLDGMTNVVISVDGRKEIHDAKRKTAEGGGSYDRVVKNARAIVERRGDGEHYIRGTFTHDNLDFVNDVDAMVREGFRQISVEPVVTDKSMKITEGDIPVILAEYEKLSRYLDEHPGVRFFHFDVDLDSGPCVLRRVRGCGAGGEYVAVAPNGDVYPCHQFVGNEQFKLGDVHSGITRPDTVAEFGKVNVLTKPACQNCWAKYYCSGGCAANAYNATGSIGGDYEIGCALSKKRIEIAIARTLADEVRS